LMEWTGLGFVYRISLHTGSSIWSFGVKPITTCCWRATKELFVRNKSAKSRQQTAQKQHQNHQYLPSADSGSIGLIDIISHSTDCGHHDMRWNGNEGIVVLRTTHQECDNQPLKNKAKRNKTYPLATGDQIVRSV
jgi:hypothetical protein